MHGPRLSQGGGVFVCLEAVRAGITTRSLIGKGVVGDRILWQYYSGIKGNILAAMIVLYSVA